MFPGFNFWACSQQGLGPFAAQFFDKLLSRQVLALGEVAVVRHHLLHGDRNVSVGLALPALGKEGVPAGRGFPGPLDLRDDGRVDHHVEAVPHATVNPIVQPHVHHGLPFAGAPEKEPAPSLPMTPRASLPGRRELRLASQSHRLADLVGRREVPGRRSVELRQSFHDVRHGAVPEGKHPSLCLGVG